MRSLTTAQDAMRQALVISFVDWKEERRPDCSESIKEPADELTRNLHNSEITSRQGLAVLGTVRSMCSKGIVEMRNIVTKA